MIGRALKTLLLICVMGASFVGSSRAQIVTDNSGVVLRLSSVFESVFRLDASLFSGRGTLQGLPEFIRAGFLTPFHPLLGALKEPELKPFERLIESGQVDHVSVGARSFHIPMSATGDPLMGADIAFDACYVLQLGPRVRVDLKKLLAAEPTTNVRGKPIWQVPRYRGTGASVMVFQESQNIFILTAPPLLNEVMDSLFSKVRPDNRVTDEIQHKAVWGIRTYRRGVDADKSVIGLDAIEPMITDRRAQYLVSFLDQGAGLFRLRYFTSSGDPSINTLFFRMLNFSKTTEEQWEAAIRVSDAQESAEQVLIGMALFGFGTLI